MPPKLLDFQYSYYVINFSVLMANSLPQSSNRSIKFFLIQCNRLLNWKFQLSQYNILKTKSPIQKSQNQNADFKEIPDDQLGSSKATGGYRRVEIGNEDMICKEECGCVGVCTHTHAYC